MATKSYEDLLVWQKSMDLVEETYRITDCLPKSEEFGLKSQMRRAAVSIPSNIAEGQGRYYPKVFREFIYVATGSLYELRTHIALSVRLKLLSPAQCDNLGPLCDEVGKMLHGLANSISRSTNH